MVGADERREFGGKLRGVEDDRKRRKIRKVVFGGEPGLDAQQIPSLIHQVGWNGKFWDAYEQSC